MMLLPNGLVDGQAVINSNQTTQSQEKGMKNYFFSFFIILAMLVTSPLGTPQAMAASKGKKTASKKKKSSRKRRSSKKKKSSKKGTKKTKKSSKKSTQGNKKSKGKKKNNTSKKKTQKPKTPKEEKVEKDFDKIRDYGFWDPIEKKWAPIDECEGVEILKNRKEKREEAYLYKDFWSYNPDKDRWVKVDISEFGYPRKKESIMKKFFKNLALDYYGGFGFTPHQGSLKNGKHIRRISDKYYFCDQDDKEYMLDFISDGHKIRIEKDENEVDPNHASYINEQELENTKFKGNAITVPVNVLMHLTLFNRLRLGGGIGLETHFMKSMYLNKSDKVKIFVPSKRYYDLDFMGLLGFNIISRQKHKVFLDFLGGISCNINTLKDYFKGRDVKVLDEKTGESVVQNTKFRILYKRFFGNVGLGYEYKMGGWFRLMARGFFDMRLPTIRKLSPKSPNGVTKMNLKRFTPGLMLGFGFNFASNRKKIRYADVLKEEMALQVANQPAPVATTPIEEKNEKPA